jgi:hypothetical protein
VIAILLFGPYSFSNLCYNWFSDSLSFSLSFAIFWLLWKENIYFIIFNHKEFFLRFSLSGFLLLFTALTQRSCQSTTEVRPKGRESRPTTGKSNNSRNPNPPAVPLVALPPSTSLLGAQGKALSVVAVSGPLSS